VDQAVATSAARDSHVHQRDRRGVPIVEHLARVVAAVPAEAQPLAWLHDVLEHSPTTSELCGQRLTPLELAALDLLTRRDDESYELYILRVAYARGAAGRLARVVKLADLEDHMARPWKSITEGEWGPRPPPPGRGGHVCVDCPA
jgi:hypothetical protein